MVEDDDPWKPYEVHLYRSRKIITRKSLSLKDSGQYMRWIAKTLADSFDRKRRPPYGLLVDLIPVLMGAAEKAELAGELAECKEDSGDAMRAYEKAQGEAFSALLSGFGLIPSKGGAMDGSENKGGRGRRYAASYWEVVKFIDELKHQTEEGLSDRKAAAMAAEKFSIGESTARRYWSEYKILIKQHED